MKQHTINYTFDTWQLIELDDALDWLKTTEMNEWKTDLIGKIDAYLCKAVRWGYNGNVKLLSELLHDRDMKLFRSMLHSTHCIHQLLPPLKSIPTKLRTSHCAFALPYCHYNLYKHSFVLRYLRQKYNCSRFCAYAIANTSKRQPIMNNFANKVVDWRAKNSFVGNTVTFKFMLFPAAGHLGLRIGQTSSRVGWLPGLVDRLTGRTYVSGPAGLVVVTLWQVG